MNHNTVRLKAVVDWLEIEIETESATNFQTVQRAFNEALCLPEGVNAWATPIDPGKGGAATRFFVRIHDVERHTDVERLIAEVGSKLVLRPGFRIDKIELALDAYCDDPAAQAASFYKFAATPVSDNRRLYREGRGTPKAVPGRFESIASHLSDGWHLAIGNKTDGRYQHIYVKRTDTQNGERRQVTERARFEIRLSGEALPYQAADDWKRCRFESLADYFRQREAKPDLDPLIGGAMGAVDQVGERRVRNRREGGTRLYSKATKAAPINEAIRQALRNLSKRWASKGKRGRPITAGADSACGNSVRIFGHNPHERWGETANSNNYICENNNTDADDTQEHHQRPTTERTCEPSGESASPIPADQSHSALDELMRCCEMPPESQREIDRLDALMRECVGKADPPPPPQIEVLEESTDLVGTPFINEASF